MEKNKNKGITLIALIVTIIVLIILAGVAISMLRGENGILARAGDARALTEISTYKEQMTLEYMALKTRITTNMMTKPNSCRFLSSTPRLMHLQDNIEQFR